MCLTAAVGPKKPNTFEDVKVVQLLLNCIVPPGGAAPLATDGVFGANTQNAISAFETTVLGMAQPDGCVDPNGPTFRALCQHIPAEFSPVTLKGTMPRARDTDVTAYFPSLLATMLHYEINTALRQAHFLAQIGHESGALRFSEELASGEKYEGRADLGNTQPGDGVRFKGRGLIQLTGRANYAAYSAATGRDFVDGDPALIATDPQLAVDVSCWFWKTHKLNAKADADDAPGVTQIINGGHTGLPDRLAYLARAKTFLRIV